MKAIQLNISQLSSDDSSIWPNVFDLVETVHSDDFSGEHLTMLDLLFDHIFPPLSTARCSLTHLSELRHR